MRLNRKLSTLVSGVIVASFVVAQGTGHRTRLNQTRSITLPSYAILDEHAQPLIGSSGKVGFVSSVTGGQVISFSMSSGKIISSVVVGEIAGPISMIETDGRRLIAAPVTPVSR